MVIFAQGALKGGNGKRKGENEGEKARSGGPLKVGSSATVIIASTH